MIKGPLKEGWTIWMDIKEREKEKQEKTEDQKRERGREG